VAVEFLGGAIQIPFSALKLASTTGVPVGVLLSAKTGANSYELVLAGTIRVPEGLGRKPENFAPSAQQFGELLAVYVEHYPYQFFNFFDLWAPLAPEPPGAAGKE
jgi:predicted LPLAT superfamily acyltransferase